MLWDLDARDKRFLISPVLILFGLLAALCVVGYSWAFAAFLYCAIGHAVITIDWAKDGGAGNACTGGAFMYDLATKGAWVCFVYWLAFILFWPPLLYGYYTEQPEA
jgi:hypothetical protein